MNPLKAFPFKNMPLIVDLIKEGEVGVRHIAAVTGMCSFDSTEVSDMLVFLTAFGRVEHTEDGWLIHPENEEAEYDRFRQRYLKTPEAILKKLSTKAKTVDE